MRFHFHDHDEKPDKIINSIPNLRPVVFQVIQYDEFYYFERHLNSILELKNVLKEISSDDNDYCTWINIDGIHRNDILDELSIDFNLHNLIKEDIGTINERMKLDLLDNGSSIYLLMKMLYIHPNTNHIQHEQISFLLKENNFLITFQEAKDQYDLFQIIKHRLKNNRGKIRSLKVDYLFYSLIDNLIENYIIVLDHIGVKIDLIDKLLMHKFKENINDFSIQKLKLIYHMKHDMLSFKILCKPLREIIIKLQKAQDRISTVTHKVHSRRQYRRKKRPKRILLTGNYFINPNSDLENPTPLFNEYIFMYFKDLNDHIIQLQDRIETYCDLLSSLTTFYMLVNEEEINKLMIFFTLLSTIFIPMMFILGLFSVNYENVPPLVWKYGYFTVLACLGTFAIAMISIFKWKKLL